ncbi:alpha/beta hydrolase [Latilactobacillus curvatus]|uniref:alpha/beta hydrolase n=1 Tax=Latilactobacillus curvatus TaxID=28038 RepID=UPI002D776031|nr:alpha/beta hydrolase [Latilactobacillus curvatus]WRS45497.1 alpha/beta hydrolase [Latilactobacillus curvatus]
MSIERQTLSVKEQAFIVDAYWLTPIPDFEHPVKHPVMIICPGGGFTYHSGRETTPVALRFLAEGFHVIVLPYQLISSTETVYPLALHQLAKTIEWVTDQAGEYDIDLDRIVLTGFSAGGHVVATYNGIATDPIHRDNYGLDDYRGHHAAIVLNYPVIDFDAGFPIDDATKQQITVDQTLWHAQKNITAAAKPAFIWQTATDALVPATNSLLYTLALQQHKIPVEYHLFGAGVHGLSLANHVTQTPGKPEYANTVAAQWVPLVLDWFKLMAIL